MGLAPQPGFLGLAQRETTKPVRAWLARHRNLTERQYLALKAVRAAERIELCLPRSRRAVPMQTRDRVIRRRELADRLEVMIPAPLRRGWDDGHPEVGDVRASVAADLVVIGKFDIRDSVRLRAAYGEERMTLAVQPARSDGSSGIARAVEAHAIVDQCAPGLMPRLLGYGVIHGDLPYLVEGWVDGHPLISAESLGSAAPEILGALTRVHRKYGVTRLPISECWGGGLVRLWDEAGASGAVPPDVARAVADLIARHGTLRCSWSHGDLVASNVLRTNDGIVLIDWENAAHAPLMRDAAKLHLYSSQPETTLSLILRSMGEDAPSGAYTPREELVLAHAQLLSLYTRRRAELKTHPRSQVYEEQVRRQVRRMRDVLGDAT